MTKSRTRKPTPPKQAAEKQVAEKQETAPMDPSVPERRTPTLHRVSERDAYALTTLVNEVAGLFPETTYETSGANAFNTRLVVAFHDPETPDLYPLVSLVEADPRVLSVGRDRDGTSTVVEFHDSFRTQDGRQPFGLAEAYDILSEQGEQNVPAT
jgi:hypothetical protein